MSTKCARYTRVCYAMLSNRRGSWSIECPGWKKHNQDKKTWTKHEDMILKMLGCRMGNHISARRMLVVA